MSDVEAIELRPTPWWREQPEEIAELPDHIVKRLTDAGYATVDDVRTATPDQLLTIRGIGRVALEEIKVWLRRLDGETD